MIQDLIMDSRRLISRLLIFILGVVMSSYKWCHGPNCHERETTTRVRGNKGATKF